MNWENKEEEIIKKLSESFPKTKEGQAELWNKLDYGLYNEIWKLNAKYIYLVGAKNTAKSHTIANYILFKMLQNPLRSAVVLRKFKSQTTGTVFNAMESCLVNMFEELNLLYEDVIGGSKKNEIHISEAKAKIIFRETRQEIRALASSRSNIWSGANKANGYMNMMWFEEPLESNDVSGKDEGDATGIESKKDWDRMMNTLLRSYYIGHESGKFPKDGVAVIMTLNDWNKDHWISLLVNEHLPFDREKMLNEHKDVYHDPDYEDGAGILIIRASAYLNPYLSKEEKAVLERIKKEDPDYYDVIALGKAQRINTLALEGVTHNIKSYNEEKEWK